MYILKVDGNILPGFCEARKANAESSRQGRPKKDKNIQNIENTQFIWKVILLLKLFRFQCVLSTNKNSFVCVAKHSERSDTQAT